MKKEEILKKAIEKAVKNGYGNFSGKKIRIITRYKVGIWGLSIEDEDSVYGMDFRSDSDLIFSHDFAKAFWGDANLIPMSISFSDKDLGIGGKITYPGKLWQFHLTQMVLEEDPISYLEKFL